MRTLIVSFLALGFSVFSACGPPPGGYAGPPGGAAPSGYDPNAAAKPECDKTRCADFCSQAMCLFGMHVELCEAQCTSQCGNGFFDAMDSAVIDCTMQTSQAIDCGGMWTCCENQLTNQICPERPAE